MHTFTFIMLLQNTSMPSKGVLFHGNNTPITKTFFYTMYESDIHFILQSVLEMMIPTRQILMILVKFSENLFE